MAHFDLVLPMLQIIAIYDNSDIVALQRLHYMENLTRYIADYQWWLKFITFQFPPERPSLAKNIAVTFGT